MIENTELHGYTIYGPSDTSMKLIADSESCTQEWHTDLPVFLENGSNLNSHTRDSLDYRFDEILHGFLSISNEVGTDSPSVVITCNNRIVYE